MQHKNPAEHEHSIYFFLLYIDGQNLNKHVKLSRKNRKRSDCPQALTDDSVVTLQPQTFTAALTLL